ncbi:MAG: S1 RNA-binding domain-containing protein [Chloroflexota bacterium]
MNTEHRDLSSPPPPLEEGYWKALLNEGEFAEPKNGNGKVKTARTTVTPPASVMPIKSYVMDEIAVEKSWRDIKRIMDNDETVRLLVVGYNRGGLLVEWQHLRGFVPASQLMNFQTGGSPAQRQERLADKISTHLTLRVIELDREQNRLVFSERAAQVQPGTRAQVLDSIHPGDMLEGMITNITDFGAFVDLGGIEGLIHISEISWGRVGHPADLLDRGEVVQVFVLDTDKNAGRVALSVKRLRPDPWQSVTERYDIGQVIEVRVTNVVDFGAFACIEEGLEGLIHVSELAEGHFLHPRNVVEEGQLCEARILSINPSQRRLGLSIRQVSEVDDIF